MEKVVDRVKKELDKLAKKMRKLSAFIDSGEFHALDTYQQSLLRTQHKAMSNYADVLQERIIVMLMDEEK